MSVHESLSFVTSDSSDARVMSVSTWEKLYFASDEENRKIKVCTLFTVMHGIYRDYSK
jgi:hypothetical protein